MGRMPIQVFFVLIVVFVPYFGFVTLKNVKKYKIKALLHMEMY